MSICPTCEAEYFYRAESEGSGSPSTPPGSGSPDTPQTPDPNGEVTQWGVERSNGSNNPTSSGSPVRVRDPGPPEVGDRCVWCWVRRDGGPVELRDGVLRHFCSQECSDECQWGKEVRREGDGDHNMHNANNRSQSPSINPPFGERESRVRMFSTRFNRPTIQEFLAIEVGEVINEDDVMDTSQNQLVEYDTPPPPYSLEALEEMGEEENFYQVSELTIGGEVMGGEGNVQPQDTQFSDPTDPRNVRMTSPLEEMFFQARNLAEDTRAALTPALGRLNTQISVLRERTGVLEQLSGTVDRAIPILEERLRETHQGVIELGTLTNEALGRVETEIVRLQNQSEELEGHLRNWVAGVRSQNDELVQQVTNHQARFQYIEGQMVGLFRKLQSFENMPDSFAQLTQNLNSRSEAFATQATRVTHITDEMAQRLTHMEQKVTQALSGSSLTQEVEIKNCWNK